MIIVLCMLIAIPLCTPIKAMIPTDNVPMDRWFFPKKECPLSQKMQRTIENLPGDTKKIATKLFSNALEQHSLNSDLLVLMRLYGNKALLTSNIECHDYGSMKLTELMPCYLELTFQVRHAVANLFRHGAPNCYISPEKLITESRIIEHQVLKTQCLALDRPMHISIHKKPKSPAQKNFIEFYMNALRQALPQELHTYISDKKIRPLHRLAMLAYDIQYTEKVKIFQSKDTYDGRDIYAHMRHKKLSMCVIQAYTVSHIASTGICKVNIADIINKPNRHTALVATQIKNLSQCPTDTALSYADLFIKNVKKITIVDDGIFN